MRVAIALSLCSLPGCGQPPAPAQTQLEACPECPAAAPCRAEPIAEGRSEVERGEEEPRVAAGTCETAWLPPGLVVEVDAATTEALVEVARAWLDERGEPVMDVHRGIVFAKSVDDLGADPPYPSFAGQDSTLACGRSALWLRQYARSLLAWHARPELGLGIRCTKNVCCYAAAGEYASSGTLVFAQLPDDRFALHAMAIVADNGTLQPDWVREQRRWVVRQLAAHMRERCRGEPASLIW